MENRTLLSIAAAVGVILIIGLVFLMLPEPEVDAEPVVISTPAELETVIIEPEPEPEPIVEPEPYVEPEPEPEVVLPPAPDIVSPPIALNDSDKTARSAAEKLQLALGRWLVPNEQIRKWVVFIDQAAEGDLMSQHRPWAMDIGSFKTYGKEGEEVLSQNNFDRYKSLVATIEKVSPETLAYTLRVWQPLFDEAYGELGKSGSFRGRLLAALDQVLVAEPLEDLPDLSRPSVMYTYADVRLESASGIQKLLWRMGPKNMAKIQLFAQQLRSEIIADRQYESSFE